MSIIILTSDCDCCFWEMTTTATLQVSVQISIMCGHLDIQRRYASVCVCVCVCVYVCVVCVCVFRQKN